MLQKQQVSDLVAAKQDVGPEADPGDHDLTGFHSLADSAC